MITAPNVGGTSPNLPTVRTAAVEPLDTVDKRASAVGQQAKAAVSAAREAGLDLPKNAQGLAASQIAKGAEPSSIFQAQIDEQVQAEEINEPGSTEAAPETSSSESDEIATETDVADGGYSTALAILYASVDANETAPVDLIV